MAFADRLAEIEKDPPGLAEVRRIISLPTDGPLAPDEVEAVSAAEVLPEALASGFRLWEHQARALLAFDSVGGGFFPLRVGGGKTIIMLLCAKHAWQRGARRILMHVPPRLFIQAMTRQVPQARRLFGFDIPVIGLGGLPPARRLQVARSGWVGIYVMPYSLLSQPDADAVLEVIDPDVVLADEAHQLRDVYGSARSRRWTAMMKRRVRQLVVLSGSITIRSVKDYKHLLNFALRGKSPLPLEDGFVDFLAEVLDAGGLKPTEKHVEAMTPILDWARREVAGGRISRETVGGPLMPDVQGFRRAFRLRRDTAPGVVASGEGALGTSLTIANLPVAGFEADEGGRSVAWAERCPPGEEDAPAPMAAFHDLPPGEQVLALLWAVEACWRTPSGDEVEYAIHGYKWRYEISAGFYNELFWPEASSLVEKRGVSRAAAEELLERSREWHRAWQRYARELRAFLQGPHVPRLDTPMSVGAAVARGDVGRLPSALVEKWRKAKSLDFEGRVERESRAIRVCDYKVRAAVEWAKKIDGRGGIVWVHNIEMGAWAHEALRQALGEDGVIYCPGGEASDRRIQDPANAGRVVVASLGANAEGKELQHWSENYFLQWPRSAKVAEQAIGRTHRPGQKADEVVVATNLTVEFDHLLYAATLSDALYVHVTDHHQKVIYADYVQSPKIYPVEFLNERGFDVRRWDSSLALKMFNA